MSLKEITKDLHTEAEKLPFTKLLLSGNITNEQYANFLFQLLPIYESIENGAKEQRLFDSLPGVERYARINADFGELNKSHLDLSWNASTIEYTKYLIELLSNPDRKHLIKAHLYVRHMGDLFGGQFIALKVPGSGTMYKFENPDQLKTAIRELLTDDLGDEARVAFEWAIKMMRELGE